VRNVVIVPSDHYHLSPAALRTRLEELRSAGRRILAVVATSGQTATGAFDDLEAIGITCEEFGAWLHVDGAHGASALLSHAHRGRMRGIAEPTR
jgi:L-2,4-diaminobutyrate decarboxylase